MMRDLFEAGLNEAAVALAAIYGRLCCAREVGRGFHRWRGGRDRPRRRGSKDESREALMLDNDFSGVQWAILSLATDEAHVCWRAALERREHVDVRCTQKNGSRAWRHELSRRGVGRGGERCGHEPTSIMRPPQQAHMSMRLPVSSA